MALSFILELVMLAAIGYWGFNTGDTIFTKVELGIGVPVIVAIVWGIWLAPASSRRLRDPFHLGLELIIFGLAILALGIAGQPTLAWIFGIVYAINVVLRYILR